MEELVKRARFTLNAILTSCLILIWSAHTKPIDITIHIKKLYEHSQRIPKEYKYTRKFVEQFKENNIDDIRILTILDLEKDSITKTSYLRLALKQYNSIISRYDSITSRNKNKSYENELNKNEYKKQENDDANEYVEYIDKTSPLYITVPPAPPPPLPTLPYTELFLESFDRLTIKPFNEELRIIQNLFKNTELRSNASVKQVNESLKTTIVIPILRKSVSTDQAIVLISFFMIIPLLFIISITSTISRIPNKNNEGISWVFFHHGKLGLMLGVSQIFLPFLTAIYIIIKGRMELIYIMPITLILLILGLLCVKKVLKARKKFYKNLDS